MLPYLDLQPDLLESKSIAPDTSIGYAASLNASGLYSTTQFVVRLSPEIHRLIDSVPTGLYAPDQLDGRAIQAFSTYLHETVHWWQHMGSTAGLIMSLVYPAQAHQNTGQLNTVVAGVGLKKSLKRWAEDAALGGMTIANPALAAANIAVNNAVDFEYYKVIVQNPPDVIRASQERYFESVGHCYWMAYGHVVALLSATVDRSNEYLPNGRTWDEGFRRIRDAGIEGFVYGGQVRVAPLGLRALFEGQARFVQLQYLTFAAQIPPTCDELRAGGYFEGIYGQAFELFLKITGASWPEKIEDPVVGLFLLAVDLAINPTAGFPFDITSFEDFILDVDPGTRFLRLCQAARDRQKLLSAITAYSRDEYIDLSKILTDACGYDHPMAALDRVASWSTECPGVAKIMAEKESFNYEPANLVVGVLLSHFVAFAADKLDHPEFYCWPGAWMAGRRANDSSQKLFLRHLSLYSDTADSTAIFPRAFPGKDPAGLSRTLDIFYGNIIMYDLTRQWILRDGAFTYEYDWLSQAHSAEQMTGWAKDVFKQVYGVHPDDFEILPARG
jgi:hypothetical protein